VIYVVLGLYDPILCWCWCPEIGTSSIDWAQLSRLLPEDGDKTQSPKRFVFNKKQGCVGYHIAMFVSLALCGSGAVSKNEFYAPYHMFSRDNFIYVHFDTFETDHEVFFFSF
jgi:hypothetical protein